MRELHEQIADLEAELDRLGEAAERCRKVMIAAKTACLGGGITLALAALGQLQPVTVIFAIAASLGGIALLGSNRTTRDQIMQTMRVREAQRAEMINALALRDLTEP